MKKILLSTILLSAWIYADFSRINGVVSDSKTTLQWQDDYSDNSGSIKQANWTVAIDYCEALELGGQSDWRLPNLNELTSLVDDTKYNPSISNVFENSASNGYWSSTSYASSSDYAWIVYFYYGYQNYYRKNHGYYVRCVRAGQ